VEKAGADALELNIAILPSDNSLSSEKREQLFLAIIEKVKSQIRIPVSIKISPYYSNLAQLTGKIAAKGINGIVLFNRFYTPDFDINNLSEKSTNTYSSPDESGNVLRWMAILSGKISCNLAASTGIHNGQGLIKQLLAGANAVQVVSTIYKNGTSRIQEMLNELNEWMQQKGYNSIDQFRGKMSQKESQNPAAYERIQFMRYFSGIQ
jgi:dihydroorotate dehydrogenase (fumarate)